MPLPSALYLALDLARSPILARVMRQQPLPGDVLTLLRIAARDPEATHPAAKLTRRDPEAVRSAAVLYIQQVLWKPDADHYRALGVSPDAPQARLREHLHWLMKWLHPDKGHLPQEEAFAARVLSAWNAVKTPERRRSYDLTLRHDATNSASGRKRRSTRRLPWVFQGPVEIPIPRRQMWWRIATVLLGALALAGVLTVDWVPLAPTQRVDADSSPAQSQVDIGE